MLKKHYAPNRCEPSIEALNFRGGGGGGVRAYVNGEVKFFGKFNKKKWGGWGGGQAEGGGWGVSVDVKFL